MQIQSTKYSVLFCIAKVIHKYDNLWCTAAQNTILDHLNQFHGIKIGRRQLCYHLADLRDDNIIKNIRRTKRDEDGTYLPTSTARCITQKGWRFLSNLGVTWAGKFLRILMRRYIEPSITNPDPNFPHHTREDLDEFKAARKKAFLNPDLRRILN